MGKAFTKKVTLDEAVEMLKQQGVEVSMGNFDDYEEFKSYFDIHYRWCLEHRSFKSPGHEVSFDLFCDDIAKIFNNK